MIKNFKLTKTACYIGAVVQATVSVFLSLLVMIFSRKYGIDLARLTVLLSVNFVVQFATDLVSVFFVDKVSRRFSITAAHILTALGFVALSFLPELIPDAYWGIFISVVIFSAGGGLLEVMISPILDSCPSNNKAAEMSRLHAMFSIGSIALVLICTAYFAIFGQENWHFLPCIWAALSALNALFFLIVPINEPTNDEKEEHSPLMSLFTQREFYLFAVIMMCGGAAEIAMSQWASAFAESALGVSKSVGDILGPCMFAVMMAAARLLYPKIAHKVDLMKYIMNCALLCIAAYLLAALSPIKSLALAGCGLCGFSVGILWPGTLSIAAQKCSDNGTAIFALMALAGDVGCTVGPALVGAVSASASGSLRTGLLAATVFPLVLFAGIRFLKYKSKNSDLPNL